MEFAKKSSEFEPNPIVWRTQPPLEHWPFLLVSCFFFLFLFVSFHTFVHAFLFLVQNLNPTPLFCFVSALFLLCCCVFKFVLDFFLDFFFETAWRGISSSHHPTALNGWHVWGSAKECTHPPPQTTILSKNLALPPNAHAERKGRGEREREKKKTCKTQSNTPTLADLTRSCAKALLLCWMVFKFSASKIKTHHPPPPTHQPFPTQAFPEPLFPPSLFLSTSPSSFPFPLNRLHCT